ncbi:FecR family protein [Devosia sp. A16]|uniref:FecR family protein n=1 Tax=Devosia sp. A16 TaxID=1736675 RepID=UPI0006D76988|nr:FecR domain-containing protein [Devosia sp. A16]
MNWLVRILATTLIVLTASAAALAAPAGSAVGVDPAAEINSTDGPRTLVVGADVFLGDLIRTSTGGSAQILFADGTRLVVGPGSSLRIEDYLLRADGSAGKMVIGALAGTFRFASGNAPKDRYSIKTPSGTIGIRGTAFDLVVDGPKSTRVLMYSGSTQLCTRTGECAVISDTCEMGEMTRHTATSLGLSTTLDSAARKQLRKVFVYGAAQQRLESPFRMKQARNCLTSALGLSRTRAAHPERATEERPAPVSTGGGVPTTGGSPPTTEPPPPPPPPPPSSGGECAGHSNPNPGNSQNCSH